MDNAWWAWIVAGIIIGILELLLPGYIFLGFAIGAVLTGIFVWLGILGTLEPITFAVFALLSLLAWFVTRKLLGTQAGNATIITRDINDN